MDAATQTRIVACLQEALRGARNSTEAAEIRAVILIVQAITPTP